MAVVQLWVVRQQLLIGISVKQPKKGFTMKCNIEIKSLTFGIIAGAVSVFLLGAAANSNPSSEVTPLQFRILSVTKHGDPVDGKQNAVLRLEPAHLHAPMRLKSYEDFCSQQGETREITVITRIDSTFQITNGWILILQASDISEPPVQRRVSPDAQNGR